MALFGGDEDGSVGLIGRDEEWIPDGIFYEEPSKDGFYNEAELRLGGSVPVWYDFAYNTLKRNGISAALCVLSSIYKDTKDEHLFLGTISVKGADRRELVLFLDAMTNYPAVTDGEHAAVEEVKKYMVQQHQLGDKLFTNAPYIQNVLRGRNVVVAILNAITNSRS